MTRRRERRLRADGPQGRRRRARARVADALRMVRLEGYEHASRASSRAASASAWRWPGRWSTGRACCCSTSRSGPSTCKLREEMQIELKAIQQAGRDHLHLRDPRPGRGADDERPAGRLQPGPDRADRHARRGLRASGDAVRGRVRRDVQSPGGAPPTRSSARPARSRSGPRRSASRDPETPSPTTRPQPPGRSGSRLPGPGHALPRGPRRRGRAGRHPAEPGDVLDEALAQQGRAVRLIWKRQHDRPVADAGEAAIERGGGGRTMSKQILALAAIAAIAVGACSRGAAATAGAVRAHVDRRGRGRAQARHLGRLRRARRRRPGLRLGHPVREGDRLQGHHDRHDRLQQRRVAHAVRRLRRHLRLGRRDDPPHPGRHRRPVNTAPAPELRRTCSRASRTCRTTRSTASTTASRTAAARTCSPTTPTRSRPPPTSWDPIWEGGADYKGKISIYDSSIFIADAALHLMTKQPDLGHHEPLPAQPGAVRRGDRPARAAARQRRALLGHRQPTRSPRSRRVTSSSARPGSTRSTRSTADTSRSRPSCPTRARPAGPTPG